MDRDWDKPPADGDSNSDKPSESDDEPLLSPPTVYYVVGIVASKAEGKSVFYRVQWKTKGEDVDTKNRDWVTRENFRDGAEGGEWVVEFGGEGLTEAAVLAEMDSKDADRNELKRRPKKRKKT
jgi:hypothetical protein